MGKYYITYERPQYFQVEVEAANANEAVEEADHVIDKAEKLDDLYFANGDLILSAVERAEDRR